MKAVLISIQPKWCDLIASGKKTIEVRKTRPKIETPFMCYIYCTQSGKYKNGKSVKNIWLNRGTDRRFIGNGKVIGEFVCDYITDIKPFGFDDIAGFEKQTCLTSADIVKYLNGFYGYGWHISDLKIYDKPRELSEFWAYNEELHKRYDSEGDFCCWDDTNEYGDRLNDCGDAYNNILNCYRCWEEWSGWCHHVTRPPQSWMYVEELQE
nr:MAG TPA: activating signal cointegrator [Caudoviricetes sp.]